MQNMIYATELLPLLGLIFKNFCFPHQFAERSLRLISRVFDDKAFFKASSVPPPRNSGKASHLKRFFECAFAA